MHTLFTSSLAPSLAVISIFLLCAAVLLARPWLMATWAQVRIRHHLHALHRQGASIVENIHFRDRKGKPVYIEYLIFGSEIVCLNSAAHTGYICGSLRDAMWCQQNQQENFRFENPLRQHAHIRASLQALLGKRSHIQTITLFTHANMKTPPHDDIITLKQLHTRLPATQTQQPPKHAQALAQLIQNISQHDKTAPSTQHGNPSRLKTAQTLLLSSVASMVAAIVMTLHAAF